MSTISRFISGKDGVGKSTVTALVGEQLALMGRKVLIIEFEDGLKCLDVFVGATQSKVFDLNDVLNGKCEINDAIASSTLSDNLDVIYSSYDKKQIDTEQFSTLVLALSENYDHILIDSDCSDSAVDSLSGIAMNSIVVSTADLMGCRDTKYLCDRLYGQSVPSVRVLFNRVRRDYIADGLTNNLDEAMDMIGTPIIGAVPEKADILRCTCRGLLPDKNSITFKIFRAIAMRIDGETVPLVII